MTVHMVRIHSENPDSYTVDEIDAAIQDWEDSHTEWTGDPISHTVTKTTTRDSTTEWLTGDFRFESSDDQTALLDDAEATLQDYVSWYRLGYHSCSHDVDPTGCSWDDEREYNPSQIPAEVPDFL